MTIKDISEKLNKKPKQGERIQFATILKAYVMDMNVESLSPAILSTRWFVCFLPPPPLPPFPPHLSVIDTF